MAPIHILTSSHVLAKGHDVIYDHSTKLFSNEKRSIGNGAAVLEVHEGDILRLTVSNSVPGLLQVVIEKTEDKTISLPPEVVRVFFPGQGSESPPTMDLVPGDSSHQARHQQVLAAIRGIQQAISHDLLTYAEAHHRFATALENLQSTLKIDDKNDVSELANGLENAKVAPPTSFTFEAYATQLIALKRASPVLAPLATSSLDLNGPATVTLKFKSMNALIDPPNTTASLFLRDGNAWRIGTTTGFGFSGLIDEHYTSRTIVDVPGDSLNPPQQHREAVEQPRDSFTPDILVLAHVFHRDHPEWAGTLGVGINTGTANGRFFGGLSYRFGSAAALTAGAAGGKVKRLSNSIDRKNLPDQTDPEASRVDVWSVSWFFSLSWRLRS